MMGTDGIFIFIFRASQKSRRLVEIEIRDAAVVAGIGDPGSGENKEGTAGITDPGYNILHLANEGECSWQEYAQRALDCCHAEGIPMKAKKIGASSLADMKSFIAKRPVYSVLSSAKYQALTGTTVRPWQEVVADYVRHKYL